jgi:hypothetical protein
MGSIRVGGEKKWLTVAFTAEKCLNHTIIYVALCAEKIGATGGLLVMDGLKKAVKDWIIRPRRRRD